MAAVATLIKSNFTVSSGLDRDYGVELYHVTGISGWTPQNTSTAVFSALPVFNGAPHPDPNIRALCTSVRLVKGPSFVQGGDSAEAIVAVTYDSERRWGAATFIQATETETSDEIIEVPNYSRTTLASGVLDYRFSPIRQNRANIIRADNRVAVFANTTQLEATKTVVFGYVGTLWLIYGVLYQMIAPKIYKLPTNQTIFQYRFFTKSPVLARLANGSSIGVDIPALPYLGEYVTSIQADGTPVISVRPSSDYVPVGGNPGNPTFLPYWANVP